MVILVSIGLLISYADRSNMSFAIIPISKENNWDLSERGWVLSSFFYGYMLTQIIGGAMADAYGGKRVLGIGSLVWTLFTLLAPFSVNVGFKSACICRFFLGVGEGNLYRGLFVAFSGVAFPAAHALLARWIPKEERSTAISLVTSFAFSGSPLAALISAPLASSVETWPYIFYLFGIIALLWTIFWGCFGKDKLIMDITQPYESLSETEDSNFEARTTRIKDVFRQILSVIYEVPWKKIFSAKEAWAIFVNQFCSSWSFYILINWLPTYLQVKFGVNINDLGIYSALPYAAQGVVGFFSGFLADHLITNCRYSVHLVRRYLQVIGMIVPAALLLATVYFANNGISASMFLTATMGVQGLTLATLSVSQHDIAPSHAGVIFGIGNLFGNLSGAIAVWLTGSMLQVDFGWGVIFGFASFIRVSGAVCWWLWAGGDNIIIP